MVRRPERCWRRCLCGARHLRRDWTGPAVSYRRSGEYLVKLSVGQQFKDAFWSVVLAVGSLALTWQQGLWVILGGAIALWFLYGAWRFVAVGFQVLGAEGDAMTRRRR